MIIGRERVSYASLSGRLFDVAAVPEDPLEFRMSCPFTPPYSAFVGEDTGEVVINVAEVFVPIYWLLRVEPERREMPASLPGRLTLPSGELWIDEIGDGSKPTELRVPPGTYSVHVEYPNVSETVYPPDTTKDSVTYTITLFNFAS